LPEIRTAVHPALRYLLFALLGSILYLLGGVLFYGAYGTLDMVMLSGRVQADPVTAGARWR
jgi:formate hydrogenlyase subunit 3/multisubunit Na+/H+ antiporter MnhD subunit